MSKFFDTFAANIPSADAKNRHGENAYSLTGKHALAQLVSTGCFRDTFYTKAQEQLDMILEIASNLDSEYIAKCAVFARQKGFMKDSPALLMAIIATRCKDEHAKGETKSATIFRKAFPLVINNGKMLRNLVQILRSGKVDGRNRNLSSNTIVKKCITNMLNNVPEEVLFRWSVGNDPSLADVIRMVRPKPNNQRRAAFFQYLLSSTKVNEESKERTTVYKGKVLYSHEYKDLPDIIRNYEEFKLNTALPIPPVHSNLLTFAELTKEQWKEIAKNASWQETRQNLNTYLRHDVFSTQEMVDLISSRLRDKKQIEKANVFPYQLLMAYKQTEGVPYEVVDALHDAMEIAVASIPKIEGKIFVLLDISTSMSWPVTGRYSTGVESKMLCIDVASLFTSAILRKNNNSVVIPFNDRVRHCELNSEHTVMKNAETLSAMCGGDTSVKAALESLNKSDEKGDLIIIFSDNESWFDGRNAVRRSLADAKGTGAQVEWQKFKKRNKNAKLICLDITPDTNAQIKQRKDVLNIGGFSDEVFKVMASFLEESSENHWVDVVESTSLEAESKK